MQKRSRPPQKPQNRITPFISISVTPDVRDGIRDTTIRITGAVGRHISMSELVMAALTVANQHRDLLIAQLRGERS